MKRAFTIYYDDDSMAFVKVNVAAVFETETPLGRAHVLRYCIGAIQALYLEAVEEMPDGQNIVDEGGIGLTTVDLTASEVGARMVLTDKLIKQSEVQT